MSGLKIFIKGFLKALGLNPAQFLEKISTLSIKLALNENGRNSLVKELRKIKPDISEQEPNRKPYFNAYRELNRRAMHAFQCSLMLKAVSHLTGGKVTVVDIGDSAGTHMLYLEALTKAKLDIDAVSVNLDPAAIENIKKQGRKAFCLRAEDLNVEGQPVDLFTSFQMVEHLHNPAIFFRRLAKKSNCSKMVITVPYLRNSRVGLHNIRNRQSQTVFAGDEHIFELSPDDWTLLMLHSGWKVSHNEVYYQYPRKWPVISQLLSLYWKTVDYEGFWGAILEKDTTFSDYYQDWED